MLVACSLVNLTTWEQAKPAFRFLALRYDGPAGLAAADPSDLHDALRPLGLWRRRSQSLIMFARSWAERGAPADASEVPKYPGMGKYASDSWAIFVDGRTDVLPNDGKLNWYMERLHAGRSGDDAGRGEIQQGDHRPSDPRDADAPQ